MENYEHTLNRALNTPADTSKAANGEKITNYDVSEFRNPVPDPDGESTHSNFHRMVSGTTLRQSRGVLYDISVIGEYITNIFPSIRDRHLAHIAATGQQIPAGFKWMLAFYWTGKQDGHNDKLSFQVIPVLANLTTDEVLDYFDNNVTLYKRPVNASDPANIYDEGHLWP